MRPVSRWSSAGARGELALPLDLLPLRHERVELALERLRRDVLADRADDDAARLVGQDRADLLLQPRPLGAAEPILRLTPTRDESGM